MQGLQLRQSGCPSTTEAGLGPADLRPRHCLLSGPPLLLSKMGTPRSLPADSLRSAVKHRMGHEGILQVLCENGNLDENSPFCEDEQMAKSTRPPLAQISAQPLKNSKGLYRARNAGQELLLSRGHPQKPRASETKCSLNAKPGLIGNHSGDQIRHWALVGRR